MRVYLPTTLPMLSAALAAGEVGPAPVTAFAVSPALREWYTEGDAEELEYVALSCAAQASLRLLAADPAPPRRRVVLAADVPDAAVRPLAELDRAAVRISRPVPTSWLASGHIDGDAAVADVARAADAVLEADLGNDDAQFAVDSAQGHELLWYAVQELAHLGEGQGLT